MRYALTVLIIVVVYSVFAVPVINNVKAQVDNKTAQLVKAMNVE